MKILNCSIINFWEEFIDHSLIWLINFAKKYNIILTFNNDLPVDLLISSVFGDINIVKNFDAKIKILYTRENLDHYRSYRNNLNLFDYVLGFEDNNNIINIPYFYNRFYELNLDINKLPKFVIENRKNLCLISTNQHYLRLQLLNDINNKGYSVDCPSLVGKNMNIEVKNKIDFIKNYYFNICPENSYNNGYTTEKLFDACVAGCIPIYYGCEKLSDGFYNKNRILHIKQDLSNYDSIIDQTIYLLEHKNELKEFMNQDPFTTNIEEYVTGTENKLQKLFYNILEKL